MKFNDIKQTTISSDMIYGYKNIGRYSNAEKDQVIILLTLFGEVILEYPMSVNNYHGYKNKEIDLAKLEEFLKDPFTGEEQKYETL